MLELVDAAARSESGQAPAPAWADLIHATKRMMADDIQAAEVRRLVRCLPAGIDGSSAAQDALAELLACFPVYRSYLPAGAGWLDAAAAEASVRRPDLARRDRRARPGARRPRARGRPPVPADDRSGDGQGRRRHRVLPADATRHPHRGRRRPVRVRAVRRWLPPRADGPAVELAAHDDRAVDPRHEARRGRARPAVGDRRARARRMGRRSPRCAPRPRPGMHRWTPCCSRRRSGHGRSLASACTPTPRRPRAKARSAPAGGIRMPRSKRGTASLRRRPSSTMRCCTGSSRRPPTASRRTGGRIRSRPSCCSWPDPGCPTSTRGRSCGRRSLVDPDNRRPVDFALRRRLLAELDAGGRSRRSMRAARRSCW